VQARFGLPLEAMIDMGDFVGGLAKYLRQHPVERLTIGGGFGKITKLAQGAMDLHSGRSQVDFSFLASLADGQLREAVLSANTAQQVLEMSGHALAQKVAELAKRELEKMVQSGAGRCDIIICDREGGIIADA
jgi:cobalt-precorrin-5B (C1)-methyltransferase